MEDREYSATEILEQWIVPTASVFFRNECLNYPIKHEEKILVGDIFLFEQCVHTGKIVGMSESMSVYRIQFGGVISSNTFQNTMNRPEHYKCIAENFPKIDRDVANRLIANAYWDRVNIQPKICDRIKDMCIAIKFGSYKQTLSEFKKRFLNRLSRMF